MHRHISFLVIAVCLSLAATLNTASAQGAATGTLVGHLTWCKLVPRPVGQPDIDPSPLADVTPAMGHTLVRPIRVPASDVQVSLLGTSLTATTDASGAFILSGVPAAQPLTLMVTLPSGPPLVLDNQGLLVASGQTRDLGSVGPVGCGDAGAVLVEAPVPVGDGMAPPDTDPAAEPADPGIMTDGSN